MGGWPYPKRYFKQIANFTLPHEWEEERVKAQLVFAKVSLAFLFIVGPVSFMTKDIVPLLLGLALPAFFLLRYFWFKWRYARFMRGSGL